MIVRSDRESQRTLFHSRLSLLRQAARVVLSALQNDVPFVESVVDGGEKGLNEKSLEMLIELLKDSITGDVTPDGYVMNLRRKVHGCLPREGGWSDGRVFVEAMQSLLHPDTRPPYHRKEDFISFLRHFLSRVDHAYYFQNNKKAA